MPLPMGWFKKNGEVLMLKKSAVFGTHFQIIAKLYY